MSPTQIKKLEAKIDKLNQKLDFVIHHYIPIDTKEDWIDDPKIIAHLDKLADEAKNECLLTTTDVFK